MAPSRLISNKVVLISDSRLAASPSGDAPVRRYRIARLPIAPRVTANARIQQLKRVS